MSEWKPPADAKPIQESGWTPPSDAVPVAEEKKSQPPGKPQAPPASQGGAGAPSTTAVTPQELPLRPSAPATEPVQPTGPEAPVPVFTPGTEKFATKSPLLPSQKPDAAKSVTKEVVEPLTAQQVRTDAMPSVRLVPETDKAIVQQKLAEQDKANRQASYYMAEYADLDQRGLEDRKKMLQGDMAAMQFMQKDLEVSAQRLQQKQAELSQRQAMIESMAGKDQEIRDSQGRLMDIIKYNDVVDQYNAEAKAFTREYKALEIQEDLLKGLAQKGEMDQDAIVRREFDIKAGIGNRPAGFAYSLLSSAGRALSGAMELAGKAMPTDQEILEAIGLAEKGSGERSRESFKRFLDDVESAPVAVTGIDRFVTPEYVQRQSEDNLFDAGLFAIADMAPGIAASIAGGMPAMAATYFASSYRDMGKEMQGGYWDQVPDGEKEAIRMGVATVSAGLATMGLQGLAGRIPIVNEIFFRAAQKMLPNMTAGQVRRIIDAETKSYVANLLSKGVQGVILEGPTEVVDFTLEEAVKHFYEEYKKTEFGDRADTLFSNAETFEQFGEGAWKTYKVGTAAGSMMGGSLAAVSSIGARQRLTDKEFKLFKAIIGDGSLKRDFESQVAADLASGKIDRAEYDKLIDNLNTAQSIVEQIPEDMSIKATREAYDLLEEKAKLKKKDKALVGDRIAKIDEKLAALAGVPAEEQATATKKEEAPQSQPAAETAVAEEPAAPEAPVVAEEVVTEPADSPVRPEAPPAPSSPTRAEVSESIINWDTQNRNNRSSEWFDGANLATNAFDRAAELGGESLGAHGMTKFGTLTEAFRVLMRLLENNIDSSRGGGRLYTAPLALREKNAGAGVGTSSGVSYREGPFIIIQNRESSGSSFTDINQAAAILVNDANIDQLNDIAAAIHAIRPDIIVAPYSMADQVASQVMSGQKRQAAATAEGPVRPEAPPTPAAAPAPTTAPTPRPESVTLFSQLDRAEEMLSSPNKKTRTRGEAERQALLDSDPRLSEITTNFDSIVQRLEGEGKIKRRCP